MSSIEERLVRDIAAVTGGVVVTESDVRDAREELEGRIDSRSRRDRRNRVVTALAAAAAVAVVVGGVAVLDRDDPAGKPQPADPPPAAPTAAYFLDLRTGTQTPLPSASIDGVAGYAFDEGFYYAASPDGSRVFWNTCCDALDVAVEANRDGTQGARLDPAGPVNIYGGGWSSDGTKFVYQRRDGGGNKFGNLFVEDTATGRSTRITDLDQSVEGYWFLAPTFSADGRTVIFQMPRPQSDPEAQPRFDLWSVPVSGGDPTLIRENASDPATARTADYAFVFGGTRLQLATQDGVRTLMKASTDISFPKMSPDGSKIAFAMDDSIRVLEISTGESDVVAAGPMAAWVDDSTLLVSGSR